jgi:two-component system nitrate/nitrite response regulator NarL
MSDLAAALRGGASGYLLKTMEGDALTSAIHRRHPRRERGGRRNDGQARAAYRDAAARHPPRRPARPGRRTVCRPFTARTGDPAVPCAGDSNKEIARRLAIAETTVKIHVQHILRKLDVGSRVQAAVWPPKTAWSDLIWRKHPAAP